MNGPDGVDTIDDRDRCFVLACLVDDAVVALQFLHPSIERLCLAAVATIRPSLPSLPSLSPSVPSLSSPPSELPLHPASAVPNRSVPVASRALRRSTTEFLVLTVRELSAASHRSVAKSVLHATARFERCADKHFPDVDAGHSVVDCSVWGDPQSCICP